MSGYEISDDRSRLDVAAIHTWLSGESYWARGRPRELVERSIAHSLCVGAYAADGSQAAFARVVTDRATFAWLCDVFVLPGHRGHGLGKEIVRAAVEHPELGAVYRWTLATADAHGLYERYGFARGTPDNWMTRSGVS